LVFFTQKILLAKKADVFGISTTPYKYY